jgi:uncharacterized membrane protein YkoI
MIRMLTLAALAATFAAPAVADRPPEDALPLSQVLQTIEARDDFGWFQEVEWEDDGYWEIEYHTRDGDEREIRVDPRTGEELD